jgi:hypothetical protein
MHISNMASNIKLSLKAAVALVGTTALEKSV